MSSGAGSCGCAFGKRVLSCDVGNLASSEVSKGLLVKRAEKQGLTTPLPNSRRSSVDEQRQSEDKENNERLGLHGWNWGGMEYVKTRTGQVKDRSVKKNRYCRDRECEAPVL